MHLSIIYDTLLYIFEWKVSRIGHEFRHKAKLVMIQKSFYLNHKRVMLMFDLKYLSINSKLKVLDELVLVNRFQV